MPVLARVAIQLGPETNYDKILAAIAMLAWILKENPTDYVSRKWHRYSVLTLAGIVLNLVGIALALSLS